MPRKESQPYEDTSAEQENTADNQRNIPRITINDPEQHQTVYNDPPEKDMSSSSRSSHSGSSKRHHSSKSKQKKDENWADVTDPDERRRIQNRIAQRKFRDKAKETKERQEREESNRVHAHYSYVSPDPEMMREEDDLSGLPWGSISMRHVVSKGRAKESESRRSSKSQEDHSSHYEAPKPVYSAAEDQDGYYEESTYYDEGEQGYYDYASGGSAHGDYTSSPQYTGSPPTPLFYSLPY